jgi:hypothetical protein
VTKVKNPYVTVKTLDERKTFQVHLNKTKAFIEAYTLPLRKVEMEDKSSTEQGKVFLDKNIEEEEPEDQEVKAE